jgi:hypothetical protein
MKRSGKKPSALRLGTSANLALLGPWLNWHNAKSEILFGGKYEANEM